MPALDLKALMRPVVLESWPETEPEEARSDWMFSARHASASNLPDSNHPTHSFIHPHALPTNQEAKTREKERGQEHTGQHLAELDAPLVEAVDVPDAALGEGDVLVVGDEGAEGARGELLREYRRRRPVAEEGLVRDELVGRALGLELRGRLADHEGLGLREEVGGEHPVQGAVGRQHMLSGTRTGM